MNAVILGLLEIRAFSDISQYCSDPGCVVSANVWRSSTPHEQSSQKVVSCEVGQLETCTGDVAQIRGQAVQYLYVRRCDRSLYPSEKPYLWL